jgi:hypothetical protein
MVGQVQPAQAQLGEVFGANIVTVTLYFRLFKNHSVSLDLDEHIGMDQARDLD